MINLSKRLKDLRLKEGLTQAELALELGLAKSTISQYESDERKPTYENLIKIADFYNISIDFLLTGDLNVKEKQNTSYNKKYSKHILVLDKMTLDEQHQSLTFMEELLTARLEYENRLNKLNNKNKPKRKF